MSYCILLAVTLLALPPTNAALDQAALPRQLMESHREQGVAMFDDTDETWADPQCIAATCFNYAKN